MGDEVITHLEDIKKGIEAIPNETILIRDLANKVSDEILKEAKKWSR